MIVYLVKECTFDYTGIIGIFSNLKLADDAIKNELKKQVVKFRKLSNITQEGYSVHTKCVYRHGKDFSAHDFVISEVEIDTIYNSFNI